MEAETIYLSHCCRELFPIIDITQFLGKAVGLPVRFPYIKVSAYRDNSSTLILARTLPPNFTPPSKHYATKTIWFCEDINKRKIVLLKPQHSRIWETSSLRVYPEQPFNTCGIKLLVGKYLPSLRTQCLIGIVGIGPKEDILVIPNPIWD